MRRFILGFLFGAICGAIGYWYYGTSADSPDLTAAKEEISRGASRIKESIENTMEELNSDKVKEELARTGTVVREKAQAAGKVIADATADARISASIKARLATEPGVSALNTKVDTTEGLVTLSGTAQTHEEVAKAVKLALETEGVVKVVSTVQVKGTAP